MRKNGELLIKWEEVLLGDLGEVEDAYFYALLRGKTVLYIGIAYHQRVAEEVKRTVNRLDVNPRGLYVCLGYVIKATFGRITQQIIGDVECCLISSLKPRYNKHCREAYTGNRSLIIRNSGCIKGTAGCLRS